MRRQLSWLLAVIMIVSPAASISSQAAPDDTKLELRNVELTVNGSLEGQLLTRDGRPVEGKRVLVRSQQNLQKVGQRIVTDQTGRFLVTGLATGTCVIECGEQTYAVRVWQKGTAPPKSLQSIALVSGPAQELRGNNYLTDNYVVKTVRGLTPRQKLALGLLAAAGIAIPIALDDDGS